MSADQSFTTARGARIQVVGLAELLTLDRMETIGRRFDQDPRIATVSLVAGGPEGFLQATAPAGSVVCVRTDHESLVGALDEDELDSWGETARDRGLRHEWWITSEADVTSADSRDLADSDRTESEHASSAHFQRTRVGSPEVLTLAIDASWLGEHETGAQVPTTSAVGALARNERVGAISLRGVDSLPGYAEHLLDSPTVSMGGDNPADICWFPNQIDFRSNFAQARSWGDRVLTTYLDLIAYDIPRYHASPQAWDSYRTLQRTTALASDGITTISADVSQRLLQEVPLLEPTRVQPISLGLDHVEESDVPADAPADIASVARDLDARPFILVLGNDFLHKNRDFAVRVWQELLRSGVACDLVLAGLHVNSSSSRAGEEQALAAHVDLRGTVHTLGHVSSQSRAWLLAHAAAVLYPSSAEGFGFVPYEAAAVDTPSSFTLFGPLAELTGVTDAPKSWRVDEYVEDLRQLLSHEQEAKRRIRTLQDAIERRSWSDFADELVNFMFHISDLPIAPGRAVLTEVAQDSAELNALLASKTWRMTAPLRKAGKALRGRPRH
jgi:glycosyltransferase involved in cell wall biosynthesis